MNSPADTLTPIVESGGFTLVEEDDVAFSLSLCREIHRIYGSYQSGDLEATDSVHVGLALTTQMLSTLASSVSRGMPAMRIQVAWAQTSEMMAVMFDEQITRKANRASRQQLQKGSSHSNGAVRPGPDRTAIEPINDQPAGGSPEIPRQTDVAPQDPDATGAHSQPLSDQKAGAGHVQGRLWDRCRRWVAVRPVWLQMMLGAFGCTAAAALIDTPIVVLLLYPDLAAQLGALYAVIAVAGWRVHRKIHSRSAREHPVPSSKPLSWAS